MSNNGKVHHYALPGAWLAATSLLSIFAWISGTVRPVLAPLGRGGITMLGLPKPQPVTKFSEIAP